MPRPRINIDWEQFDKLCAMQCTLLEIASFFDCSDDTIERACKREKKMGFAEYYEQKRLNGCISLRRKMFETALNGNVTMMIWLSKQMLGHSDKSINKVEQSTDIRIGQSQSRKEELKVILGDETCRKLSLELAKRYTALTSRGSS